MHACVVTDQIDIRQQETTTRAPMYALQLVNTPCFTSKHQRRSSLAGLLIEDFLVQESTGL